MENIVNVQIKLDEQEMASFVERGLHGLSDEKIAEVLLEGFKKFLDTNEGRNIFFNSSSSYGYVSKSPSDLAIKIIKMATDNTSSFQNEIDKVADKITEYLNANIEEIVKKYIVQAFCDKLFSTEDRWRFESATHRILDNYN